jgi:hypothetical protein
MSSDSDTFKYKAGQNEVEISSGTNYSAYVHVHYSPYGEYKHVIVLGMPKDFAEDIDEHWKNGGVVFLEWEVVRREEAASGSSAHTVAEYRRHILR